MVEAQTGIDAIVNQDTHPLPFKSGLSNKTKKDEAFGQMNSAKVPARAMKMICDIFAGMVSRKEYWPQ